MPRRRLIKQEKNKWRVCERDKKIVRRRWWLGGGGWVGIAIMSNQPRKPLRVIPFDEIKQGVSVRYTERDNVQYLSVRDIIMAANEQTVRQAGNTWRIVSDLFKDDILLHWNTVYFDDRSESVRVGEPVITFQGAMKLLVLLPRPKKLSEETSKANREIIGTVLKHYYSGKEPLLAQSAAVPAVPAVPVVPVVPIASGAKSITTVAATARDNAAKALAAKNNSNIKELKEALGLKKELLKMQLEYEREALALHLERNAKDLEYLQAAKEIGVGGAAVGEASSNPYLYPWVRTV
jgi:hypothetical protein